MYSFTIFGHLSCEIGRYAWMLVVWKWMVALPTMFGVWNDTSVAAFLVETSDDYRLRETDKDIGDTLSSILGKTNTYTNTSTYTYTCTLGIRSVLLQLLPVTTVLSLFVQVSIISYHYFNTIILILLLTSGNCGSPSVCYFK